MDFQCIKGFTLKNGKHYGVYQIITQSAYDKLPERFKMYFQEIPEYKEDEDKPQDIFSFVETNDFTPDQPSPDFTPDPDTPDFPGYGGGDTGGAGASETY